jgi:hypothetical protein
MKLKMKPRERSLLSVALHKYDRLCQGTSANLTTLNLPNMQVETARGNIEVIRERLDTADDDVELQHDLRLTVKDALAFALTKYQKVENDQTELLVGTSETEETMNEVRALQRKLADQMDAIPEFPGAEGIDEIKQAVKVGLEE